MVFICPNPPSNFHLPAGPWGCALFLSISKVPNARRQGVTSEAYQVILRREERPQSTQQVVPWWWIRVWF